MNLEEQESAENESSAQSWFIAFAKWLVSVKNAPVWLVTYGRKLMHDHLFIEATKQSKDLENMKRLLELNDLARKQMEDAGASKKYIREFLDRSSVPIVESMVKAALLRQQKEMSESNFGKGKKQEFVPSTESEQNSCDGDEEQ